MQNNNSAYITEAPPQQENSLRAYVNQLDEKMGYARWKQDLILSYNYMPLANIKQKLQNDRINYAKKMEMEEARLRALVDNEQITTLLFQLSNFKKKLKQNVQKTEQKIKEQKIILNKLKIKANERREALKEIKRGQKWKLIQELKGQGIKSARDIKMLMRSKSTMANGLTSRRSSVLIGSHGGSNGPEAKGTRELLLNCLKALEFKSSQSKMSSREGKRARDGLANYNSVPLPSTDEKPSWAQFSSLPFSQLLALIHRKDPTGSVLKLLLDSST